MDGRRVAKSQVGQRPGLHQVACRRQDDCPDLAGHLALMDAMAQASKRTAAKVRAEKAMVWSTMVWSTMVWSTMVANMMGD
jgi:hypothetical protein